MDVVFVVVGCILGVSALIALYRVVRGPSILDRMVALEVLLVTVMCVLLAEMAHHNHTRTLPVVLILTALGFVGSTSVARYVSRQDAG